MTPGLAIALAALAISFSGFRMQLRTHYILIENAERLIANSHELERWPSYGSEDDVYQRRLVESRQNMERNLIRLHKSLPLLKALAFDWIKPVKR